MQLLKFFCWNNVAYRSLMAMQINIAGKTDISGNVNQVNKPWCGALLWGLGNSWRNPRKIHIAEKVALGPQQLWNLCRIEVFIQGTQLFSPSSALPLSPHSLSKRQRSNVLTYLCHLVSSFNFKHLPATVFYWSWTWKQEFTAPAS